MTATAGKRLNILKPGTTVRTWQRQVLPGEVINPGAVVAADPVTHKWVEAAANPTFTVYGVARCEEPFDNTAGSNTTELLVDSGCFRMFCASADLVDAHEGSKVYVDDDQTFSRAASAVKPIMGTLVEVYSPSEGFVQIEPPSAHDHVPPIKGADLTSTQTINVLQGKWRVLPAATLSAPATVTLAVTGAVLGDLIRVTRRDQTANALTIANGGPATGNVAILPASKQGFVDACFDGSDWGFYAGGSQLT